MILHTKTSPYKAIFDRLKAKDGVFSRYSKLLIANYRYSFVVNNFVQMGQEERKKRIDFIGVFRKFYRIFVVSKAEIEKSPYGPKQQIKSTV